MEMQVDHVKQNRLSAAVVLLSSVRVKTVVRLDR